MEKGQALDPYIEYTPYTQALSSDFYLITHVL